VQITGLDAKKNMDLINIVIVHLQRNQVPLHLFDIMQDPFGTLTPS